MKTKTLKSILFLSIFLSALNVFAATVEYTIPQGTADGLRDWNDRNNPVRAQVGDTLVIFNADSAPHQLHTNNVPCPHGDLMQPGGSWSCVLTAPYDSRNEKEPVRDHLNYDLKFWLVVSE